MNLRTFNDFMEDHKESDPGGSMKIGQQVEYKDGPYGKIICLGGDDCKCDKPCGPDCLCIETEDGKKKVHKKDAFKKMIEDKEILYVAKGHKDDAVKKDKKNDD